MAGSWSLRCAYILSLVSFGSLFSTQTSIRNVWGGAIISELIPIDDGLRNRTGILTTHSPCRMPRWLYATENVPLSEFVWLECHARLSKFFYKSSDQLLSSTQLQEHDTVFVPYSAIKPFVDNILGNLTVNIVVISGQTGLTPPANESSIATFLEHQHIARWFCQNLPMYGGSNPHHSKISPFPYGLQDVYHREKYESYKKVFFESLKKTKLSITEKTDSLIFSGPLNHGTNPGRKNIRTAPKMIPEAFYSRMAKSRYILSPDGDRPECWRHYEALGLGTMPITELDPSLFHHFGPNVVYNTSTWNVTALDEILDPKPVVNHNLVREAYWMEWANGQAGVGLKWNNYSNGNGLSPEETALLASMDWPLHTSI